MTASRTGRLVSGLVTYHPSLEPLLAPIDTVQPHPDNYNNGDIEKIAESIEVNGMYRPVYVQQSTGYIVAGNSTWNACKTLGAEQIPVVMLDINDNVATKIMVADNRIASLAVPDNSLLLNLLSPLDDLLGTGYTPGDLDVLNHLNNLPVTHDEFGQWPTISVQVPPHVRRAYLDITSEAIGDLERFQLLLRLAGWDGSES